MKMKTFARRRTSSLPSPKLNAASPEPQAPCRCRSQADWSSLPDTALLLVAHGLPRRDRPRCRLVCRGWAAAAGAAVEAVTMSLSPLPLAAARQLAAAHRCFPGCTRLTLCFPNFLLPGPTSQKTQQQRHHPCSHNAGKPPRNSPTNSQFEIPQHRQQRPQRYAAPLVGGPVGSGSGRSGSAFGCENSGVFAGSGRGLVSVVGGCACGCFSSVTSMTLDLGVAGRCTLPLDSFYRLPQLRRLVLRGLAPQPSAPEPEAAAAAESSSDTSGGERLGVVGFPFLEDLEMGGLLSYRMLLEVAQLTSLRSLSLRGRAHVERSEFVYMAALRRLSTLSRLEHLAIDGPVFAVQAAGCGVETSGFGNPDCATAVASLATSLTSLTSLYLSSVEPITGPVRALVPTSGSANQNQGDRHGEGREGGGDDAGGAGQGARRGTFQRYVPCSWTARAPLSRFSGLRRLVLREPGRLNDGFWADLAEEAEGGGRGGGGRMGMGGVGDKGGDSMRGGTGDDDGVVGLWRLRALRSLSLTAASSGILDEMPSALVGLTRLHLAGVHLDSFSLLTRLRRLTDLRLKLPPEGCDTARRHNVALLAALGALTRLQLRTGGMEEEDEDEDEGRERERDDGGPTACGGSGSGAGSGDVWSDACPGGRSGVAGGVWPSCDAVQNVGGCLGGFSGDQLLLNDSRLQALSRGCRRLEVLIFAGIVQLSDVGLAVLGANLSRLTRLRLHNESEAPAVITLRLLPATLERISLYALTVVAAGAEAVAGTAATVTPHPLVPDLLLPRCRVLHLDYCRGTPMCKLLPLMGGPLEELRLQYRQGMPLQVADAAATGALLTRLRKLQVSCSTGAMTDFAITRLISPPAVTTLSTRRPAATEAAASGGGASSSFAASATSTQLVVAPPAISTDLRLRPSPGRPQLTSLTLRLPSTPLSLDNLRALGRLTDLRSMYVDTPWAAPRCPAAEGLLAAELRGLAALTALTLGPAYTHNCGLQPTMMAALGQLQAALLTCRIQQAG